MFHSVMMLKFFDRKDSVETLIILLTGHVICSRVTDRSHLSPPLGIFQARYFIEIVPNMVKGEISLSKYFQGISLHGSVLSVCCPV